MPSSSHDWEGTLQPSGLKVFGTMFHVIRLTEEDERRACEIIFSYTDKDFSFTDAISFAVMERLGITVALSLDEHFVQFGKFTVVPLQTESLKW